MSLLVMGIGVVTLATLFPISILRTVRATQLTHATVLFRNADALVDTYPHLLHDPDNDANYYQPPSSVIGANLAEHADEDEDDDNRFDTAPPSEDRNMNGRFDRGVFVVDPLGWYTHRTDMTMLENVFGNPPPSTPGPQIRRFNGVNTGMQLPNPNTASDYLTTQGGAVPFFFRQQEAYQHFALPDSWTTVAETVPTSPSVSTSVDLPEVDLTDVDPTGPSAPRYRVTLFDTTGRGSVTRIITAVDRSTNRVRWDEHDADGSNSFDTYEDIDGNRLQDTHTLTRFIPGRARLEQYEPRYTWLLTVRKAWMSGSAAADTGKVEADVVVFFNRSYSAEDETVYAAVFMQGVAGFDKAYGIRGQDDDQDGTADNATERGVIGTDDNRTAFVFWSSSSGLEPRLNRGEFVFDAVRGHWYRIQDFRAWDGNVDPPLDNTMPTPQPHGQMPGSNDLGSALLLDRDIVADAPVPGVDDNRDGTVDDPLETGGMMLPRGVVDVFPLRPRVPDPAFRER